MILDEPTAALDVRSGVVLNLVQDLKARLNMSYLFVTTTSIVRLLCERVTSCDRQDRSRRAGAESCAGGAAERYTRELIAAIPHPPL